MDGLEAFDAPRLDELLDEIASEKPAPGAGSVAALASRWAQDSPPWRPGSRSTSGTARPMRSRRRTRFAAGPRTLAPADGHAYEEVLTALRLPEELESVVREAAVSNALARAAEIPLEIAGEAEAVAELASRVAERGNANLRSDAAAGAVVAAAAARVAAHLVAVNLREAPGDERIARRRNAPPRPPGPPIARSLRPSSDGSRLTPAEALRVGIPTLPIKSVEKEGYPLPRRQTILFSLVALVAVLRRGRLRQLVVQRRR